VWFTLLGFGARFLQPLFEKPRSWQFLDGVIAIIMFTIAVNVLSPLV
jgi:L-lysine exporter family protein LysE/ArgO